jgi:hypothetical protein
MEIIPRNDPDKGIGVDLTAFRDFHHAFRFLLPCISRDGLIAACSSSFGSHCKDSQW